MGAGPSARQRANDAGYIQATRVCCVCCSHLRRDGGGGVCSRGRFRVRDLGWCPSFNDKEKSTETSKEIRA